MPTNQCPNCGSYDTMHVSAVLFAMAIACALVGLVIWPLQLLTVALLALAIATRVLTGVPALRKGSRWCKECKIRW